MPATASAVVTTTDITAPADPARFYLETVSALTLIEGTSDGDGSEELALWCLQGVLGDAILKENVDVEPDGDFSTTLGPEQLELGRCRLRALPEGTYAPTADLSPFSGPLVTTDAFQRSRTGSGHASSEVLVDYFVNQQQAQGFGGYTSIGSCGLCGSRLFYGDTERSSEWVFYVNGRLDAEVPTLSRAGARVDGHNAWGSAVGFEDVEPGGCYTAASEELEGVPPLTFSVNGIEAFQEAGVDVTVHEEQDLVRCRDGDPMPLAEPGCGAFVPSGIRVERDIHQSRDGTLFEFETRFRSVDGQEHALDLLWTERFYDGHVPPSEPGFQFPGNGDAYAAHAAGDTIPAPDGCRHDLRARRQGRPRRGPAVRAGRRGLRRTDRRADPLRLRAALRRADDLHRAGGRHGDDADGLRAGHDPRGPGGGGEGVRRRVGRSAAHRHAARPRTAERSSGPPTPAAGRRDRSRPLRRRAQRVALPRRGGADRDRRRHTARHRRAVHAERGGEGVVRDRAGAARAARGREVPPADARQPRRARCTRFVRVGRTITRSSPAGASRLRFTGRIARRALRPGRHRMVVRAADAAGNRSKATTLRFRVVRR